MLPLRQMFNKKQIYEKDAYQVHKHRNYTLKRGRVLRQRNIEVLNKVLRWAGLENNNKGF